MNHKWTIAGGIWLLGLTTAVSATPSDPVESFHFAHRISPILAKVGCSAAECHGGGNGQGGFKLSLFAAKPRMDYEAIARELGARRLDHADPENSLLLKKPTRKLKHKGGRLLRDEDEHYRALLAWIADGAPYAKGETRELAGIDLELDDNSVIVRAEFREGGEIVEEDVTGLALLESTNGEVVSVGDDGTIDRNGPGEAWILARYGKFSARLPVRRPFDENVAESSLPAHPLDAVWSKRMRDLGLGAAGRAPDHILARRLFVDLTGRPPTPLDLYQFYALAPEDRVAATADRLLQTGACEDVLARHVGEWFEIPAPSKDPRNANQRNAVLRDYFRSAVGAGDSLSKITRDVLTVSKLQPAWKHFADPRDRAEYVGRTMLGIRIGCARCHDHPLDRWTNREHLHFAAFFSDPRPAPDGGMMAGKLFLPGTSREVEPVLLPLGEGQLPDARMAPEDALAWFVLERGQAQYARNTANRVFGMLMGRHLVEMPNDHRLSNPALHEPMLDLLADQFAEGGFDLKSLVRLIATSRIYALSSEPRSPGKISGDPAVHYLARREARPLTPAQFAAAVEHVLGVEIEREETPESPLARELYVMNSGLIQKGLRTPGNQVDAVFEFEPDAEKQLSELYRLLLSRDPSAAEKKALLPELRDAADPVAAGRDLAFALMASREFGSLR